MMYANTMEGKRKFLSRILYDDSAWTLPDERIIAAYCAYHRIPQALEEAWIEYKDNPPPEDKIVFTKLDTQFGETVVDEMSQRDMIRAAAELEKAEREYQAIIQSTKVRARKKKVMSSPKLKMTDSVQECLDNARYVCYFFYGQDDTLLYVGKTNNFSSRWADHVKTKDISQVDRIEMHTFNALPDVLFYETQMIIMHKPVWNKRDVEGYQSSLSIEPVSVLHISVKQPVCA